MTLTDQLPVNIVGNTIDVLDWNVGTFTAGFGTPVISNPGDLLTWNIGTLNAGQSVTVTATATIPAAVDEHGVDSNATLPMNLFQLDGNAEQSVTSGGWTGDDWDNILGGVAGGVDRPSNVPPQAGFVDSTGVITDGAGATIFTQGGSKDVNDVTDWKWTNGSVPDKDDLLHAYAAVYEKDTDGDGIGEQILFFGTDRFANNGDAALGFWFFQQPVAPIGTPTGNFSGAHEVGDIFIVSDFSQGGSVATVFVYRWVGGSDPLELVASGNSPAQGVFGIENSTQVPSPWNYTAKNGTVNAFPVNSFFEGGINLSRFGLAGCFTGFLAETRSSTSLTAQLKDFVSGSLNTCKLANTATATYTSPAVDGGATQTITSSEVEIGIFDGDPQRAAGGEVVGNPLVTTLTSEQLEPIVAEAQARWVATGLGEAQLARLQAATVQVADLGGDYLGLAAGSLIQIDPTAAGYGWFVDATPADDSEFLAPGDQGEAGRMDLLGVVMHEMGHVLGLEDLDTAEHGDDLMADTLATGVRRYPAFAAQWPSSAADTADSSQNPEADATTLGRALTRSAPVTRADASQPATGTGHPAVPTPQAPPTDGRMARAFAALFLAPPVVEGQFASVDGTGQSEPREVSEVIAFRDEPGGPDDSDTAAGTFLGRPTDPELADAFLGCWVDRSDDLSLFR